MLINVELIIIGFVVFFVILGMVSYGARLEQKYNNLKKDYDELTKYKEK